MAGPQRITRNVALIELPLPLAGLTSVNCYVLQGESETVLVDPGWSSPETDRALHAGLEELGLGPRDVARSLMTHHHWDHYTHGLTWQRAYDVPVHLGKGEDPSIEAWHALEGAFPRQVGLLERAGAPALAHEVSAIPVEPWERDMDFEPPARWIDDGDVLDLGGLTVQALATPGHTRGHVCFEVVEHQLLLTGDHVLPHITPSIAYEREPDPRSLATYLDSLRLVAGRPELRLLPAHRAVGGQASERARQLMAHHDERLGVIEEHVAAGRSTSYEIAAAMTWTRRDRQLEDLDLLHRMTAVLEVAAHLEVLREAEVVDSVSVDGVDHFRGR
jgi:glyoxylase-like metal-dependent hydrolase (beta-lactamase superfamily II)